MNSYSYQALMQAFNLLPHAASPHCLGKVLCTLVFVKIWSDAWLAQRMLLRKQGTSPAQITDILRQCDFLVMDTDSVFDACRSQPPMPAAAPIHDAISILARDNPDLSKALNPAQFGAVAGLYTTLNTDPARLGQVLEAINEIAFEHAPPSMACGVEFSEVITAVCVNNDMATRKVAPLIAQLMQPMGDEVVVDFACGDGNLLWALAAELALHRPLDRLQLLGMESDPGQWALATLLFSVSRLKSFKLHAHSALNVAFTRMSEADKAIAIGGADMVVMAVPEYFQAWNNVLAHHEKDPRFPVRPPFDSRVALAWLGLAALKPAGGRMALLMPVKALEGQEGLNLRKHLVDMNLLDAVMNLPGLKGQVLLLIRSQKAHATVAFIQVSKAGEAGLNEALAVAQAWQCGQTPAKLIVANTTTLAQHLYPLDLRWYQAPDSVRFPKAPRHSSR